ncbi:hypothetical protein AU381_16395 [Sinorhizobium glycinis]|uniref:Uncharacterized protein n=1 Tax=Sinorhizobium glycinis TaxID=1472378 RepID=A0A178Y6U3_9HYPH|nr:hypothetical protein AU381_16395 [Sinorhizobium glycinis]
MRQQVAQLRHSTGAFALCRSDLARMGQHGGNAPKQRVSARTNALNCCIILPTDRFRIGALCDRTIEREGTKAASSFFIMCDVAFEKRFFGAAR